MAQFLEVSFIKYPRVGEPAEFLHQGNKPTSSTVTNVQSDTNRPGYLFVWTASGSCYSGIVNVPNTQTMYYSHNPTMYQAQQPRHNPEHSQYTRQPQYPFTAYPVVRKNRVTAGVLALVVGGLGAHKFYLGQIGLGIVYLLFCLTGIPAIIALIEGILYLTMSDQEFAAKYG